MYRYQFSHFYIILHIYEKYLEIKMKHNHFRIKKKLFIHQKQISYILYY